MAEQQETRKIFIVDDDETIRKLYAEAFSKKGTETEVAENGEEAIQKLRAMDRKPDLILLDMMMPKINGLGVLTFLKDNLQFSRIPVIMLTSLETEGDVVKALEMGVILYLVKTQYTPNEVVAKVEEILAGYIKEGGRKEIPGVRVAVKDIPEKK